MAEPCRTNAHTEVHACLLPNRSAHPYGTEDGRRERARLVPVVAYTHIRIRRDFRRRFFTTAGP